MIETIKSFLLSKCVSATLNFIKGRLDLENFKQEITFYVFTLLIIISSCSAIYSYRVFDIVDNSNFYSETEGTLKLIGSGTIFNYLENNEGTKKAISSMRGGVGKLELISFRGGSLAAANFLEESPESSFNNYPLMSASSTVLKHDDFRFSNYFFYGILLRQERVGIKLSKNMIPKYVEICNDKNNECTCRSNQECEKKISNINLMKLIKYVSSNIKSQDTFKMYIPSKHSATSRIFDKILGKNFVEFKNENEGLLWFSDLKENLSNTKINNDYYVVFGNETANNSQFFTIYDSENKKDFMRSYIFYGRVHKKIAENKLDKSHFHKESQEKTLENKLSIGKTECLFLVQLSNASGRKNGLLETQLKSMGADIKSNDIDKQKCYIPEGASVIRSMNSNDVHINIAYILYSQIKSTIY